MKISYNRTHPTPMNTTLGNFTEWKIIFINYLWTNIGVAVGFGRSLYVAHGWSASPCCTRILINRKYWDCYMYKRIVIRMSSYDESYGLSAVRYVVLLCYKGTWRVADSLWRTETNIAILLCGMSYFSTYKQFISVFLCNFT